MPFEHHVQMPPANQPSNLTSEPGPDAEKSITIIAAMARDRAIGRDGGMPWRLPGELRHFKRTTMGKTIVMGRITWESIGHPLPGRQNIVISRSENYRAKGCLVVDSLQAAIRASGSNEVMVIGGGQLYSQALPLASRMVLTLIDCSPEADTWFPDWEDSEWRVVSRKLHMADESNDYDFEIVELTRIFKHVSWPARLNAT